MRTAVPSKTYRRSGQKTLAPIGVIRIPHSTDEMGAAIGH
jgi:hypothetical protein